MGKKYPHIWRHLCKVEKKNLNAYPTILLNHMNVISFHFNDLFMYHIEQLLSYSCMDPENSGTQLKY